MFARSPHICSLFRSSRRRLVTVRHPDDILPLDIPDIEKARLRLSGDPLKKFSEPSLESNDASFAYRRAPKLSPAARPTAWGYYQEDTIGGKTSEDLRIKNRSQYEAMWRRRESRGEGFPRPADEVHRASDWTDYTPVDGPASLAIRAKPPGAGASEVGGDASSAGGRYDKFASRKPAAQRSHEDLERLVELLTVCKQRGLDTMERLIRTFHEKPPERQREIARDVYLLLARRLVSDNAALAAPLALPAPADGPFPVAPPRRKHDAFAPPDAGGAAGDPSTRLLIEGESALLW
eukprot:TRINITY_DN17755_c0_g1_i1.p1 TRINITY_DN17755_c0_g1~~TRINITY_DN17755_c0_g1_i1.p1  ORF type:complete len:293 (+),score=35.90 TRINITY_DN17755_c0_g1_i1:119-997(+)